MSSHIGRFEWLKNPQHAREVEPITPERVIYLEGAISQLIEILGGKEKWVLTGGLTIPATKGEFYRNHQDIDIGLHESDLEEVAEHASKAGYGIFSRVFMSNMPKNEKIDLYKRIDAEEAIKKRRKNLRFVRLDRISREIVRHVDILDYFDIYPHHTDGPDIISNDDGLVTPTIYHFGDIYYTQKGPIRLRSLRYIEILKRNRMSKIDKLDLQVIKELVGVNKGI